MIALLKAAGARDFRVGAENGRGGACQRRRSPGVAIAAWYRAIEAGDLAALNARFVTGDLSDIDWELWRRVRLLRMEIVEGFENDDAATVTVRGRDPDGRPRRWGYHLVRRPAGRGLASPRRVGAGVSPRYFASATSAAAVVGPSAMVSVCAASSSRNSSAAAKPVFRPFAVAASSSLRSCSAVVIGQSTM